MVVLVLKNLRSMYFGQTDVIFETLRQVLMSLGRVLIFVDEADTAFGQVGPQGHETERRLTGKVQAMMSDPVLRGRVKWLLMTARIQHLSPDIRRPGRVGDLIIPVLDPEGEDKDTFIRWMVKPVIAGALTEDDLGALRSMTDGYSAASFASMRSELIAGASGGELTVGQITEVAENKLLPNIGRQRTLQTLQALVNCTDRRLIPQSMLAGDNIVASREDWLRRIQEKMPPLRSRAAGMRTRKRKGMDGSPVGLGEWWARHPVLDFRIRARRT